MFKPDSVNGRRGTLQVQTREPIKSIRIASDFTKSLWLEKAKEDIMTTIQFKIIQQREYYSTYDICNLISQSFSETVTDYNYIYFVIIYVISFHVTSFSPTLETTDIN